MPRDRDRVARNRILRRCYTRPPPKSCRAGALTLKLIPVGLTHYFSVMPGLVPGIHVFLCWGDKDVDGRDKPGHDAESCFQMIGTGSSIRYR
jgi:hypothetical protein